MTHQNSAAQAANKEIDAIMEQAQVFASAWAFYGGPFDQGDGKGQAEREEAKLRDVIRDALSKLRAEGVQADEPVADAVVRQCPRCTGNGTILRLSGNGPDAYDVQEECSHCEGSGVVASAPVAGEAHMPPGYRVKAVDGHGYRITSPTGSDWVAHSDTPAGDLIAALLAAPQASEAVRILFPAHLRKMWSGGEVQAWLDNHQGITPPKPNAKNSLERYRKWQSEQPQADKDGCANG